MASARGIKAAEAYVELGVLDKTKKALANVRGRLTKWATSITKISAVVAAGVAAVAASIVAATKQFAKVGDDIGKMAKRTNLSTDAVQSLGFAFEQAGGSAGSMEIAIKGMSRQLLDLERGLSTAKYNFQDLNLTTEDFEGLNTESKFKLILDRLGAVRSETRRAALAMKIFGRSGADILPLIGNVDGAQKRFNDLGLTIDRGAIEKAEQLTDTFNELSKTFIKLGAVIGEAFGDDLKNLVDSLASNIKRVESVVSKSKGAASGLFAAFRAATAGSPLQGALDGAGAAVNIGMAESPSATRKREAEEAAKQQEKLDAESKAAFRKSARGVKKNFDAFFTTPLAELGKTIKEKATQDLAEALAEFRKSGRQNRRDREEKKILSQIDQSELLQRFNVSSSFGTDALGFSAVSENPREVMLQEEQIRLLERIALAAEDGGVN